LSRDLTWLFHFNTQYMEELINRLKEKLGLNDAQALEAITIIKDYAKQKLPLFSGAIEKMFDKYVPKEDEDFLP
jgi:hypothetical protein